MENNEIFYMFNGQLIAYLEEDTIEEKLYSYKDKMYVKLSFATTIDTIDEYIERLNYLNEQIDKYTEFAQLPYIDEEFDQFSKYYFDNLLDLTYLVLLVLSFYCAKRLTRSKTLTGFKTLSAFTNSLSLIHLPHDHKPLR